MIGQVFFSPLMKMVPRQHLTWLEPVCASKKKPPV
jgi:hypothetical protein